jgi:hypothetical protein
VKDCVAPLSMVENLLFEMADEVSWLRKAELLAVVVDIAELWTETLDSWFMVFDTEVAKDVEDPRD